MSKLNRSILAGACIMAAAGCASSSSTSSYKPPAGALGNGSASVPGISAKSGIETITGTATGATVIADQTTWNLVFTGPVKTIGTFTSPAGQASHVNVVFKTAAGDMAASAVVSGQNSQPKMLSGCSFQQDITAVYTVSGARSTGDFKDSTGNGIVKVVITASLPKLKSGKCNESSSVQPLAKGAISTFNGSGPLTVK